MEPEEVPPNPKELYNAIFVLGPVIEALAIAHQKIKKGGGRITGVPIVDKWMIVLDQTLNNAVEISEALARKSVDTISVREEVEKILGL